MKKFVNIASWSLFGLVILTLLAFVDADYRGLEVIEDDVNIDRSTGHEFVTKEGIGELLNNKGYSFEGQTMDEIHADLIEHYVGKYPGVKNAEVYKNSNGVVSIEISQRRPIARVLKNGGLNNFYVDEEGLEMGTNTGDYIAKVPLFTGEIDFRREHRTAAEVMKSDSLQELYTIDDVYKVAMALDGNDFMKAQILQIDADRNGEFTMIPRVGNHKILFGNGDDAELKFEKLEKFYTEAIEPKELNLYHTVNVKYFNQIICSKR